MYKDLKEINEHQDQVATSHEYFEKANMRFSYSKREIKQTTSHRLLRRKSTNLIQEKSEKSFSSDLSLSEPYRKLDDSRLKEPINRVSRKPLYISQDSIIKMQNPEYKPAL